MKNKSGQTPYFGGGGASNKTIIIMYYQESIYAGKDTRRKTSKSRGNHLLGARTLQQEIGTL